MFSERGHADRMSPAVSTQHCCILQVIWECRRLVFRISLREYSFRCCSPQESGVSTYQSGTKTAAWRGQLCLCFLLLKTFSEFRLMMVTDGYTGVFLQLTNRRRCTLAKWGSSTVVIQASAVKKSRNKNVNAATCCGGVHVHHQFYDPWCSPVTSLVLSEVSWGDWPSQWPPTWNKTCCQKPLEAQTLTLTNPLADVRPPVLVTVHLVREQTGKTITVVSKVAFWGMTGVDKCGPAFAIYNAQDERQMSNFWLFTFNFCRGWRL